MAKKLDAFASRLVTAIGAGTLAVFAVLAGMDRAQERSRALDAMEAIEEEDGATAAVAVAVVTDEEAGWDLPNLDHPQVEYWIRRFQTDKRDDYRVWLGRMGRYASFISSELDERGMPQDLVYLAMIESGFNPKAYSHADAAGLWQFIAETGERYGLDINRAVDERNDPVKSTEAALRYLTYLYKRFDSWYLAAAAYNTGENRIGRIMREVTGSERGTDEDYYRIWDRLPRDTRDYVPAMIAAARIAKDPEAYGFDDVERLEPWRFMEVVARPATPLEKLAKSVGATVKDLKSLNPHLKLNRTRNDEEMVVRVPEIRQAD